jgi:myosin-5
MSGPSPRRPGPEVRHCIGGRHCSGKSQTIIFKGESGTGKSFCARWLLQCIEHYHETRGSGQRSTWLDHPDDTVRRKRAMTQASDARKIGRRMQAASSILRAFVNCKTVRNRDASRMGFWAELYVHPSGYLGGVQLSCHVLDKPRVDDCPLLERTFHIFYQLLAGMDAAEREQFGLGGSAKDYHLLSAGVTELRAEDAHAFRVLEDALTECGFDREERRNVFGTVAAVLLLGNVEFETNGVSESVINKELLKMLASLLGVDARKLSAAICRRKGQALSEQVRGSVRGAAEPIARFGL